MRSNEYVETNPFYGNRLAWFYYPIWREVRRSGWWTAVVCGKPNSGKSLLSYGVADALDISTKREKRFSFDRMYFDAEEFRLGITGDHPDGTAHILDDAGLNLFNRDAMSKEVKKIAKTLQTIRFKNGIILFNLPALPTLEKVSRMLSQTYIQTNLIDDTARRTLAGIRWQEYSPTSGRMWHEKPVWNAGYKDTWLGYSVRDTYVINQVWFDAPSVEDAKRYEAFKEKRLNEKYAADAVKAPIVKKTVKEDAFAMAYAYVSAHPDEFSCMTNKGLVYSQFDILAKFPDLTRAGVNDIIREMRRKLLVKEYEKELRRETEEENRSHESWRSKFKLIDKEISYV